MPSTVLTPLKTTDDASADDINGVVLPPDVQAALHDVGFEGISENSTNDSHTLLKVTSDLDEQGRWGERYLVATSDRLIVLSVAEDASDKNRPEANVAAASGNIDSYNSGEVTIDLDVPMSQVEKAETKSLVGTASLELRLKTTPDTTHSNGAAPLKVRPYNVSIKGAETDTAPTNGGSINGASVNGAHSNGAAGNGAAAHGEAAAITQYRIVEALRSSNAHSKALGRAARQLEHLREHGTLDDDPAEAEKWQRATCPNCGRALPENSKVCAFCVNKWRALRRLFSYVAPYKWIAIANGLLSVADRALSFVPPIIFAYLVDFVFLTPKIDPRTTFLGRWFGGGNNTQVLGALVGLILLMSLINAIVAIVRGRSVAYLGSRVLHDLRTQLYGHLQRLSLSYFDKREVGAVMSRVQNDVGMIQNFLLDGAENVLLSSLTIIGVTAVLMTYSWQLTLLVLLPVPFVIVGTNRYWRGLMKLWRRVWHQNSGLGARLADTLGGVRVVRAFAQEGREVDRFIGKSGELRDATIRVEQKAAAFYPILGFIMGVGSPLAWYFGGRQLLAGTLTLGELSVFTFLLTRLYEPVQQLTRLINFTTRAMTAAERVFEVLDTEPEVVEKGNAIAMPTVRGSVEFDNVVFGYDKHRPVLHGINLKVEAGQMIGLVGHSGAGKSTLINLLMRFYDVGEGAIKIDGIDLRDIRRDDIRAQIGIVLQEPYLFHGNVAANIAYGKPDATPAEIMAAAKAAYAHDFIVNFPDGYDTLVGERGTRLSGGERQRISIARAILHNPKILILDEATASVDTETEQQIQSALQNLTQGRTTIAIAHRLSTLRNAHRLIVLEGGHVVEQGTHDELMERRGVFFKLVNAQQAMNEVLTIGG